LQRDLRGFLGISSKRMTPFEELLLQIVTTERFGESVASG
jgi:hypothetical protein